jgi:16S rRNA (cytosine967-C5)-methyltransferase
MYQLIYLDRVPDHAIVSEAVKLAKIIGHQGIANFVNGVLRSAIRSRQALRLPETLPPVQHLSLATSHPEWLVERWIEHYGTERAAAICEANNRIPYVTLRVNRLKATPETCIEQLRRENFEAAVSRLFQDGLVLGHGGDITSTEGYRLGLFSIQDESSMLVAPMADPRPGDTVVDACAAPGGKSCHLAEWMGDQGLIYAFDIHAHKINLINRQAERLGLTSIQADCADALELPERFRDVQTVLLDAPCSGTGVIRRKPDIKWNRMAGDIAEMAALQRSLLKAVARIVKPGGVLVYSTCSIEREENQENIAWFLSQFDDFELDRQFFPKRLLAAGAIEEGMISLTPEQYGTDGFFIARLRRLSGVGG